MAAHPKPHYTLEQYFELESSSEERYEFWNGEVFAMSGGSDNHLRIEFNLIKLLGATLTGRDCRIFTANARIKVPAAPPYRYADLSALCEPAEFEKVGGVDTLINPTLLIEVLSPSTEAYDRGDKFVNYQSISSLREYLRVAQDHPHVTQLVRRDDGDWTHRDLTSIEDVVKSAAFACDIPLREIYQDVAFANEEDVKPET